MSNLGSFGYCIGKLFLFYKFSVFSKKQKKNKKRIKLVFLVLFVFQKKKNLSRVCIKRSNQFEIFEIIFYIQFKKFKTNQSWF